MDPKRIPLFPLDIVLFPGLPLPLHIFEPRYKLMIRYCVDEKLQFGVVLSREGGIADVGCTASILEVARTYPDGKMDIKTEGKKAFHVLEVFEEMPYYEAEVDFLEDEPEARSELLASPVELLQLYDRCHQLLFGEPLDPDDLHLGGSLAFQIAGELPLDLDYKQELLEIRKESERRIHLLEKLGEWLPQLEHLQKMRQRAGGNGHGFA